MLGCLAKLAIASSILWLRTEGALDESTPSVLCTANPNRGEKGQRMPKPINCDDDLKVPRWRKILWRKGWTAG
jgi:hypothetical protein